MRSDMKILKTVGAIGLSFFAMVTLSGCLQTENDTQKTIRVGTILGPGTQLMNEVRVVARDKYGLTIIVVPYSHYTMPNKALSQGKIDANMFQDRPYLQNAIRHNHYKFTTVGKTFSFPMAIYSNTVKRITQVPNNASVVIPEDPSNRGRALLLLQSAKLIKLKPNVGYYANIGDVIENPKHLKIITQPAANLTKELTKHTLAVINSNYAIAANLYPDTSGIFVEKSTGNYGNLVVVRTKDKDNPAFTKLVEILHSPKIMKRVKVIFKDQAMPVWLTSPYQGQLRI